MSVKDHPYAVAHYHFPRVFAGRNDDRVVVFANGHVYDRAERRKSARMLIQMCRRERERLS